MCSPGIYRSGGRERLVMSFAFNHNQQQFRLLAHGVVDWLTHGVHLGYWRNYFAVHVDDLFAADARWSTAAKCTPGEGDCPPGTPDTTSIRMTAADVSRAVTWQQQNGFTLDMLYNAAGSDQTIADTGSDALTRRCWPPRATSAGSTTPTPTSSSAASRTSPSSPGTAPPTRARAAGVRQPGD